MTQRSARNDNLPTAAAADPTLVDALKARVRRQVEANSARCIAFSHRLHATPELAYEEFMASTWLAEELTKVPTARVEHGVGELPTAVRAQVGTGELVVTICAEYDALPEVGHACGHNVIASSALGAFIGLAEVVDELGITLRLLGTPAEESGGGKIDLLRQGAFDGTHAAMMVHPGDISQATMTPLACTDYQIEYTGVSAHASASPWAGVNAQDAMVVAMTAIGLARQQLEPLQQIHGALHSAGGAPNVITESATGVWVIRAESFSSLNRVSEILRRCFAAGALATGATLKMTRLSRPYGRMKNDAAIAALFAQNAVGLGRAMDSGPVKEGGSTDMANVSQYFPAIHPMLCLGDGSATPHTAEFAELAGGETGDATLIDAAMAMAFTTVDLASDPQQRERLLRVPAPDTSGAGAELDDKGVLRKSFERVVDDAPADGGGVSDGELVVSSEI
ncbi:M20 family metallopeptidase [Leekyejoonella antrihumi]|uniref:Peptidase M20 domain-containing protein 2 n=1 Tax=Leekyejoonella antrihumi TaxID=1660198 RepID=A0A563E1K0_9MICO|nr:M20 family metallopeptidase [Leekyejoonella antrihumi]TWP35774.1 M20 family metallopeptidase [Leekyejoonella antrihumi]